MYYKNMIEALGHTPMVELNQLSPNPKVKIMAKLEGQNVGGSASVKDRIARYMVEKAEESGELNHDKTILEATSGNTGIALAWLGKKKGYKVTIVMPDTMSIERQQMLKMCGAELILSKGALKMNGAIKLARDMAANNDHYFMPDQFSNAANPLAHYETTSLEILSECPYEKIDAVVIGIGTGGTITGVGRRMRERSPQTKIIGVEPPIEDGIMGLRSLEEYLPPVIDLTLIDQRTKVTSKQAAETARQLFSKEGIFAGISSGAAMFQALKVAAGMESGTVVTLLPDGGWKYLSMDYWQSPHSN